MRKRRCSLAIALAVTGLLLGAFLEHRRDRHEFAFRFAVAIPEIRSVRGFSWGLVRADIFNVSHSPVRNQTINQKQRISCNRSFPFVVANEIAHSDSRNVLDVTSGQHYVFWVLRENLESPAILAVRLHWPLQYPQPPSLWECGNPRFVRVPKRCGNRGKVRLLTFPRFPWRVISTAKPPNKPNQALCAYKHAGRSVRG